MCIGKDKALRIRLGSQQVILGSTSDAAVFDFGRNSRSNEAVCFIIRIYGIMIVRCAIIPVLHIAHKAEIGCSACCRCNLIAVVHRKLREYGHLVTVFPFQIIVFINVTREFSSSTTPVKPDGFHGYFRIVLLANNRTRKQRVMLRIKCD